MHISPFPPFSNFYHHSYYISTKETCVTTIMIRNPLSVLSSFVEDFKLTEPFKKTYCIRLHEIWSPSFKYVRLELYTNKNEC